MTVPGQRQLRAGSVAPWPQHARRSGDATRRAAGLSPTEAAFRHGMRTAVAVVPDGVRDGCGRPAGRRFDVYRNTVAVSLREALETGFPALRSLIGAERFAALARAFVTAHPPDTPLLALYGARLPTFLRGFAPLQGIGYLADVARLEQALREAYHAADACPLAPSRLHGRDGDALAALRVRLAPALRLVESHWPVVSIRRFALEGGAKPPARAEAALVTRPGFDPDAHVLPEGGAAVVAALSVGATLGDAAEAAGRSADLPAILSLLARQGALVGIAPRGDTA